jgi:hypothetical protein
MFCAFTIKAQQNLVLNGSFEQHTPFSYCYEDYVNSNPPNITNYGNYFYIFRDPCQVCASTIWWGGGAQEGNYVLEVGRNHNASNFTKFSFTLSEALFNEKNYKLSFFIKKPPPPAPCISDVKNNYIKVGISNSATSFGTHLLTSPLGSDDWQEYSIVFNTQNAEEYLTVEVSESIDTSYFVLHIDNFVLVETEEQPNAIFELNTNTKQLLKIVDVLGKEVPYKKNVPLFYMYSDGTVEKKLIIE